MKKIISALLILTMLASMVCVSTSASGVYLNADFSTMSNDQFYSQFMEGRFEVDDAEGVLYGYYEAKSLQTMYDDPDGVFNNTLNTWLTYDASITVAFADDDLVENDRYVNIAYCNDNLRVNGLEEKRSFITFTYDVQKEQFCLSKGDGPTYAEEGVLMDPVPMSLDTDGETFYTLGMSIDKNRIRFFIDNQLIYDFDGTEQRIAEQINSPFMFWNDANYIRISNIMIAAQGHLFPYDDAVETSSAILTVAPDVTGTDAPNPENPDTDAPGTDAPINNGGNAGNAGDAGNASDAGNNANNEGNANTEKPSTSGTVAVEVTDDKGQAVTDDKGQKVTSVSVVTDPAPADTNKNKPAAGNATATGDATFVVIAAMVATLGCAVVIKKVSVK